MKKRIIKKNRHRPSPFRIAALHPIFLFNRNYFDKEFEFYVMFGSSCRYNIGIDQSDWNKLGGICLSLLGPHYASYRLAWRWCENKQAIEIAEYYYCNGKGWYADHLAYVPCNSKHKASIKMKARDGILTVVFSITEMATGKSSQAKLHYAPNHCPRLGFGCGLYFGGNRKAPHDMEIFMSNMEVK